MNKVLIQLAMVSLVKFKNHEFDDEKISIIDNNFQSFIEEVYKVFVA